MVAPASNYTNSNVIKISGKYRFRMRKKEIKIHLQMGILIILLPGSTNLLKTKKRRRDEEKRQKEIRRESEPHWKN